MTKFFKSFCKETRLKLYKYFDYNLIAKNVLVFDDAKDKRNIAEN